MRKGSLFERLARLYTEEVAQQPNSSGVHRSARYGISDELYIQIRDLADKFWRRYKGPEGPAATNVFVGFLNQNKVDISQIPDGKNVVGKILASESPIDSTDFSGGSYRTYRDDLK